MRGWLEALIFGQPRNIGGVMARKKAELADTVTLLILRDGVFIDADVKRFEGDQCEVRRDIAEQIIRNGHGRAI
jgi:hypothetical protein